MDKRVANNCAVKIEDFFLFHDEKCKRTVFISFQQIMYKEESDGLWQKGEEEGWGEVGKKKGVQVDHLFLFL